MIGAIIGDIVGSRFEFDNHRLTEFELFIVDCFVTDDSIMTLAIAKVILETDKSILLEKTYKKQDEIYMDRLSSNTVTIRHLMRFVILINLMRPAKRQCLKRFNLFFNQNLLKMQSEKLYTLVVTVIPLRQYLVE